MIRRKGRARQNWHSLLPQRLLSLWAHPVNASILSLPHFVPTRAGVAQLFMDGEKGNLKIAILTNSLYFLIIAVVHAGYAR